MKKPSLHSWTLDPEEAIRLQKGLHGKLLLVWESRPVNHLVKGPSDWLFASVAKLLEHWKAFTQLHRTDYQN